MLVEEVVLDGMVVLEAAAMVDNLELLMDNLEQMVLEAAPEANPHLEVVLLEVMEAMELLL